MRKLITTLLCLILISFSALALASEAPQQRTITVTGDSLVTCAPDMATVELCITTSAKTSKEAQQDNARLTKAVRDHLYTLGIKKADIDSTQFSLSPQYSEEKNKPSTIVGYMLRHSLTVTVNDLNNLSAIIDGAMQDGVTQIGTINYDRQDKDNFKAEALTKAAHAAQQKALTLAKAFGESGPKLLSVSETGVQYRPHAVLYKANAMRDTTTALATELSPNDIEVTASVTAVFVLP